MTVDGVVYTLDPAAEIKNGMAYTEDTTGYEAENGVFYSHDPNAYKDENNNIYTLIHTAVVNSADGNIYTPDATGYRNQAGIIFTQDDSAQIDEATNSVYTSCDNASCKKIEGLTVAQMG
jgi:hypothetical protein